MSTYTFHMLDNGKMPEGMRATLSRIFPSYAGKKISLSIREAKEKRSLDQNSYYRGVILPHVRQSRFDMGDPMSLDAAHEDNIKSFAPVVECKDLFGNTYTRPLRTHEMSVAQMAEFITAITATMAQFGYPVPEDRA